MKRAIWLVCLLSHRASRKAHCGVLFLRHFLLSRCRRSVSHGVCFLAERPEKPTVGRFGSLTAVFNDDMVLSFSIYGPNGTPNEGNNASLFCHFPLYKYLSELLSTGCGGRMGKTGIDNRISRTRVSHARNRSSQTDNLSNWYLSLPNLALGIIRIGQRLVSSVSG